MTATETSYNKPLPNIDLDNKPFWDGLAEHKFLLFRCKTCGAWYWPKAYCRNHENEPFMGNLEWTEASGRGKVFSFNIHHWAFHPGFKDDVPYAYALIETDEGPLISTMITGIPADQVKVGMPVEIVYEDHPDVGFTLPKARPIAR
jgi:uncharacterized protein